MQKVEKGVFIFRFVTSVHLQAQKIVQNALNVFEELEQVRQTKSSSFGFIVGHLLAKSAYIEAELALTSPDTDEQVLAACQVPILMLKFLYMIICHICSFVFFTDKGVTSVLVDEVSRNCIRLFAHSVTNV